VARALSLPLKSLQANTVRPYSS